MYTIANLEKIGLWLEPCKTQLVEFNTAGKVDTEMDVDFKDQIIKNRPEAKFLGISIN